MEYSVFLIFMTGSIIVYGLMFWMWVEKWVSLELILGVVTVKFIVTVGWAYGLKVKNLLKRRRHQLPPEEDNNSGL
jgi:hypothetical protein